MQWARAYKLHFKMKTKIFLLVGIIVCLSLLFGCDSNDADFEQMTFSGRVVDPSTNQPIADVSTRITNGKAIRTSMVTLQDGLFCLTIAIADVDESFYLELIDKNGNSKKETLKGFGSSTHDYGDIPFVNVTPSVETIGIVNMTQSSFCCKCNVVSKGNAPVTERGLCWGTNIPTVADNKVTCGSGEGIYTVTVDNIDISTTTYYACAYAVNIYGTVYGEAVEINSSKLGYFSLPTMEFGGYTYHIHSDLGSMQWEQGNNACENLMAFGYDDWYLPNKEEMFSVAMNTNILNQSYLYWTSSHYHRATYGECYYWLVYNTPQGWSTEDDVVRMYMRHVIPVRKD